MKLWFALNEVYFGGNLHLKCTWIKLVVYFKNHTQDLFVQSRYFKLNSLNLAVCKRIKLYQSTLSCEVIAYY